MFTIAGSQSSPLLETRYRGISSDVHQNTTPNSLNIESPAHRLGTEFDYCPRECSVFDFLVQWSFFVVEPHAPVRKVRINIDIIAGRINCKSFRYDDTYYAWNVDLILTYQSNLTPDRCIRGYASGSPGMITIEEKEKLPTESRVTPVLYDYS